MAEPERTRSPAYAVLRASSRRVDRLIQSELARQGGGVATIFNDQFELCGSRRVYRLGAGRDPRAWLGRDRAVSEAVHLPTIRSLARDAHDAGCVDRFHHGP